MQGEAGTGKSRIVTTLQNDPNIMKHARVLTPTGTAATHSDCRTYHSSLKLPIGETRAHRLQGNILQQLQQRWTRDIKLIIMQLINLYKINIEIRNYVHQSCI